MPGAQRLQKLLEDAGIKLDSVATDIRGVSCRRMIEALIAGERDPEVLADMALTRMRPKIPDLREALVGHFDDHHALMARMHLDHIDELSRLDGRLEEEVNRLMVPFAEAATHLVSVPGIGKRVAEVVVAEIGVDMSRFPGPPSAPDSPPADEAPSMLAIMLTRTAGRPAAIGARRPYSATGSTASAGRGWSRRTSVGLEEQAQHDPIGQVGDGRHRRGLDAVVQGEETGRLQHRNGGWPGPV